MNSKTPLYKAVWFWDKEFGLSFQPLETKKSVKVIKRTYTCTDIPGEKTIEFLENVDLQQQKKYKNYYQRVVPQDVPNVVTLQDVKDVVTFLVLGYLPVDILALFHCYKINRLLRALIVYFQLYLQVWEDLDYRRRAYGKNRLKHPVSSVRETRCRNLLSKIRSRIGLEYAHLISGEGEFYRRYHHMNNPLNRSYSSRDMALYEFLFRFSARVVWVTLSRSNYKEIEQELSNIMQYKPPMIREYISKSDRSVLHGHQIDLQNHRDRNSPVISDIFQNEDDSELLAPKKHEEIFKDEMTGMDACLDLPEELLHRFGLIIGILGESRDNFEAMLHVKQNFGQSIEEQEIEKALGIVEVVEKPYVKLKYLLSQLETPLQLYKPWNFEETTFDDVKDEIKFYLANHMTDSRKSYLLWRATKGVPA